MIKNYNKMMRHARLSDLGMALGNNNAPVWVMLSVINKLNSNTIYHCKFYCNYLNCFKSVKTFRLTQAKH